MAKEMVDLIRETEAKGSQMTEEASQKAKQIVSEAEKAAVQIAKDCEKAQAELLSSIMNEADIQSKIATANAERFAEKKCAELISSANVNYENAVLEATRVLLD